MIIKGLLRRYQRWNPVHPTVGAFWGMGIGIGCGVGWGPGFGPEVIGYVGAGCGVGFNVGLTLAGIGIGLPANSMIEAPYNATVSAARFLAGRSITTERENNSFEIKMEDHPKLAKEIWNNFVPQISSAFTRAVHLGDGGTAVTEPMKTLSCGSQPIMERFDSFINTHIALWRDPRKSPRSSEK